MDGQSFPMSTGQVSSLLRVRERRLQETVRLGVCRPPVVAGRRLWGPAEVLAAAKHLGVDTLDVRRLCQSAMAAQAGRGNTDAVGDGRG